MTAPIRAADAAAIAEAAQALRTGALVAFPTETVYGLGADATSAAAVAALYAAKGRPAENPLIMHFASAEAAFAEAAAGPEAERLAAAFWPGPLTLVLPRRPESRVVPAATAGLDSMAVRVPAAPVAQLLLAAAAIPVAAPSANPSGRVSPTTAQHVAEALGDRVALILDGGPCPVGLESTVVGLHGPRPVLLRPGGIGVDAIEGLIGPLDRPDAAAAPASPGMLARHYAPATRLRLNAVRAGPGEALLAFGPEVPATVGPVRNLSPDGNLAEAAANLYAMLRELDRLGAPAIAVMPIPATGLGLAINDRLRRAAAV
jgi:L-threonylcarbamoyladenylate synthase